ncbi:glycerol-3-phosphate cytidylyltransferase [Vibrio sp. 10N.222.55.F9]|uniref:glycerol-3-phosphate cytidylyltransferase n=1 Tax=Vibrio sp. 10N.222.55.F9 TaxID=1884471 RepID=UPI000C82EACA|nr:glycerol-3-phosphate cytidylyltransferase [Vibrio sp. 10N.222.55.F9]PMO06763.1 glycerol-3-phosphate cytidylyltransferase [Vibrio sp. 10N.222.55.F9]
MKRIMTYGTFDLLHPGHINLLRRAREMGDELYVGLSTDKFNRLKHKTSFYSFEDRRLILESIKYVDLVIEENNWEQKIHDIKKHRIDVFVIGDDWVGEFDYLSEFCEVIYLKRTKDISSTIIKERLGK